MPKRILSFCHVYLNGVHSAHATIGIITCQNKSQHLVLKFVGQPIYTVGTRHHKHSIYYWSNLWTYKKKNHTHRGNSPI